MAPSMGTDLGPSMGTDLTPSLSLKNHVVKTKPHTARALAGASTPQERAAAPPVCVFLEPSKTGDPEELRIRSFLEAWSSKFFPDVAGSVLTPSRREFMREFLHGRPHVTLDLVLDALEWAHGLPPTFYTRGQLKTIFGERFEEFSQLGQRPRRNREARELERQREDQHADELNAAAEPAVAPEVLEHTTAQLEQILGRPPHGGIFAAAAPLRIVRKAALS